MIAAIVILLAVAASPAGAAIPVATSSECPTLNTTCSAKLFKATIVPALCPAGTEYDSKWRICFSPCSNLDKTTITYTPAKDDPSLCVPSCAAGKTTVDVNLKTEKVSCTKCSGSAVLSQHRTGTWICTTAAKGTTPTQIVAASITTRSMKDRYYRESSCPENTRRCAVSGRCLSCDPAAATAAKAATPKRRRSLRSTFVFGDEEQYDYYSIVNDASITGVAGNMCVPDSCCIFPDYGDEYYVDEGQQATTGKRRRRMARRRS